MGCIYLLIAAALVAGTYAQGVAQQCLTEQLRSTNTNNQPNNTPEGTTMAAFDSICRSRHHRKADAQSGIRTSVYNGYGGINNFSNFDKYVNCFQTHLPASNIPADRFLLLVFSRPDMERAYRGLCTQDLENLRRNIRCLLSTPVIRACYNTFNQGVNQVVNLQTQNRVPRETLQTLACNVSVARYQCETDIYSVCDAGTGQIMRDFFSATVPGECRRATGVRSRHVAIFSGGNAYGGNTSSSIINLLMLNVLAFVWKM